MVTSPTELYTLSLHDALPIYRRLARRFVFNFFRVFEGQKNPPAKLNRVFKTLQSRREFFPLVMPEVGMPSTGRSEEHTSELQSHHDLVCRLLLEKKKKKDYYT